MKDNLRELLNNFSVVCPQFCGKKLKIGCRSCSIEQLVDHLTSNCVIIPPCKVGDTVYKVVNDKRVKRPYECEVVGFWISKDETCNNVHLVRYVNGVFDCSFSVPFTEFGKTLFSTEEEAEKVMRGDTECCQ